MPYMLRDVNNRACLDENNRVYAAAGFQRPCPNVSAPNGLGRCHKATIDGIEIDPDLFDHLAPGWEGTDADFSLWPKMFHLSPYEGKDWSRGYAPSGMRYVGLDVPPEWCNQDFSRCEIYYISAQPAFMCQNFTRSVSQGYTSGGRGLRVACHAPFNFISVKYLFDAESELYQRIVKWVWDTRILFWNITEQAEPFDASVLFEVDNQLDSSDYGIDFYDGSTQPATLMEAEKYYVGFTGYGVGNIEHDGGARGIGVTGGARIGGSGGTITIEPSDCCACECVICHDPEFPSVVLGPRSRFTINDPDYPGMGQSDSYAAAEGDGYENGYAITACGGAGMALANAPSSLHDSSKFVAYICASVNREYVYDEETNTFACKWVKHARYLSGYYYSTDFDNGLVEGMGILREGCWWKWISDNFRCPPSMAQELVPGGSSTISTASSSSSPTPRLWVQAYGAVFPDDCPPCAPGTFTDTDTDTDTETETDTSTSTSTNTATAPPETSTSTTTNTATMTPPATSTYPVTEPPSTRPTTSSNPPTSSSPPSTTSSTSSSNPCAGGGCPSSCDACPDVILASLTDNYSNHYHYTLRRVPDTCCWISDELCPNACDCGDAAMVVFCNAGNWYAYWFFAESCNCFLGGIPGQSAIFSAPACTNLCVPSTLTFNGNAVDCDYGSYWPSCLPTPFCCYQTSAGISGTVHNCGTVINTGAVLSLS